MNQKNDRQFPRARKEDLLQQRVADELLVYDMKRHKAHCLNPTAATVWEHCDGKTAPADIARKLERESGVGTDETLVWLALDALGKQHLLSEPLAVPPAMRGLSRREALRRIGLSAAAVTPPLVITLLAPRPALAVTCLGSGAACGSGAQCCSGLCNSGHCL